MRILHVIQQLDVGGAERLLLSLARRARADGHEVAWIAAPGRWTPDAGAPVFPLPMIQRRPRRVLAAARIVRRVIDDWQPDIVHCHNPVMTATVAIARVFRRVPALASVHGLRTRDYANAARLFRLIGLPVASCGAGVTATLARHGVSCTTIPNGVTPAPAPTPRAEIDAQWPSLAGRRLIGASSRLVPLKNVSLAIRALRLIPGAALFVVGDGPQLETLQRQVTDLALDDRVVFAGFRDDVRELMGAADVIVVTSTEEGLPLAGLEAFAAGRPLVAVRASWQMALARNEEHCLLVEPDDDRAMASAIQRILGDDGVAARLVANGRELARHHTDAEPARAYMNLYEQILDEARPTSRRRRRP